MSARFSTINLALLPTPEVVEQLDFEAYLKEFVESFKSRAIEAGFEYDIDWIAGQTDFLESDPIVKVLEVAAYREMILRQRVNDAARQVLLSSAGGFNLENLAAFFRVERMSATSIVNNKEVVTFEDDERFRYRISLAPEAYSCAGSEGAYEFFALGADLAIKSVRVITPNLGDGQVHVLPLINSGDGTPTSDIITLVREALTPKERRPLTDILVVRAPGVVTYQIDMTLQVPAGPDATSLITEATKRVQAYASGRHKVAVPHYRAGITAAGSVGGVENVIVTSPAGDVVPQEDQAAFCTAVNVTAEVIS